MTKKLKLLSKRSQDHVCPFCDKKFHEEKTAVLHICPKKRRKLEIDLPSSRIGFRVFQRFFELSYQCKTTKTVNEFINSNLYIEFVKFGHYLVDLNPPNIEKFIDFVIRQNFKMADWNKEVIYDKYIVDFVKKENPKAAIDRAILYMYEWSGKNNCHVGDFFKIVTANEASHMIKRGKLSPWMLYLSESGDNLMKSFNEDHAKIIKDIIDPDFWFKKFNEETDEVENISDLLKNTGL